MCWSTSYALGMLQHNALPPSVGCSAAAAAHAGLQCSTIHTWQSIAHSLPAQVFCQHVAAGRVIMASRVQWAWDALQGQTRQQPDRNGRASAQLPALASDSCLARPWHMRKQRRT